MVDLVRRPTVAIVGGGASGSLLATQLGRRLHPDGLRIVLVERRSAAGRGLAYASPYPFHRLNVPAQKMGAFPRDATHFLRWAQRRDGTVEPQTFVPRGVYGDYLTQILAESEVRSRAGVELVRVTGDAVAATVDTASARPHARVALRDGTEIAADRLVLAFGNLPPALPPGSDPRVEQSDRYHGDPWDPALPAAATGEDVLLIGTGLTMVDVALMLRDARSLRAVSRNGLLPRTHRLGGPEVPAFELPRDPFTLDELLAEVDGRIASAKAIGADWRAVVDSLRPVTNRIWQRLAEPDRDRFVRDVSRHWEVRRHRMAPEVAQALDALVAERRLRVDSGSVVGLRPVPDGIEVELAGEPPFVVDRVVNCTGPSLRVGVAGEPLLAGLLDDGAVRPGPFALGLDHDSRGALLTGRGTPSAVVYGIGPVRKGRLWETTAIPEIRAQSFELADLLTAQLACRSAQALRV